MRFSLFGVALVAIAIPSREDGRDCAAEHGPWYSYDLSVSGTSLERRALRRW